MGADMGKGSGRVRFVGFFRVLPLTLVILFALLQNIERTEVIMYNAAHYVGFNWCKAFAFVAARDVERSMVPVILVVILGAFAGLSAGNVATAHVSGALRTMAECEAACAYEDVLPLNGRLLVFDSRLAHEVRPNTHREGRARRARLLRIAFGTNGSRGWRNIGRQAPETPRAPQAFALAIIGEAKQRANPYPQYTPVRKELLPSGAPILPVP